MVRNEKSLSVNRIYQGNRQVYIKNKQGDKVGGNFLIPNGDFSHFLGFKKVKKEELKGKTSGIRTIEITLKKAFRDLGEKSMQRGMAFRNMFISHSRYMNKPGAEKDMINDLQDSVQSSLEYNRASNTQYLELQYKFSNASKKFGTISNLMKVRHESVKKSINEVR